MQEADGISIQSDLTKAVGCTLTEVRARLFCVEFLLHGATLFTVRITKEFKFAFNDGIELRFDPMLAKNDVGGESAKFVQLIGSTCQSARLDKTRFELAFEGGARLWVEFEKKDFEPLHVIGADRRQTLEFHYVL